MRGVRERERGEKAATLHLGLDGPLLDLGHERPRERGGDGPRVDAGGGGSGRLGLELGFELIHVEEGRGGGSDT